MPMFRVGLLCFRCLRADQNFVSGRISPRRFFALGHRLRQTGTAAQNAKVPPKVKVSEIRRLIQSARPERWHIAGAIGLMFVSTSVTMAVPFCMGKVIDIITAYDGEEKATMVERLTTYSKILLGVFVLGGVANSGRVYMIRMSGQRIVRGIRTSLFSSIMRKETAFFDRSRTGELVNRLSADTLMVGESLTTNIADGLRSVVQIGGGIGMMLFVSPKLTVLSLGILPVLGGFMVFYGRYVKAVTQRVQSRLADATQVAEERISSLRTVRSFAQEANESVRFSTFADDVLQLARKDALARAAFFGLTGFAGNVIVLTVFYSGGLMMNEGALTMGELSSFLLYAAYAGMSIGGLSTFYSEFSRALGASSRIWEIIDDKASIEKSGTLIPSEPVRGHLTFENIQFAYETRRDSPLFSGVSLDAPPGSILALVGRSGSGKSTVASLLLRLYDPQEGVIRVDGHDIRSFDLQWWRQQIGTVSQEPVLFSCTVGENIGYGISDVTPQRIEEAARQAHALDFIRELPDGFDTVVGERGVLLSGGQRQRVAIARAIIREPSILLLDEATSALDSTSEKQVQAALESVMKGRTVLTIAHRLSTIRNAHQVAVLENGRVAELGTYDQLMSRPDGTFRQLVERQVLGLTGT